MSAFVGRDFELAKLGELARLNVPSLVVIKGRRRVGKSRLATEFAARLSGYRSILITGMAPDEKVTAADEREDFASRPDGGGGLDGGPRRPRTRHIARRVDRGCNTSWRATRLDNQCRWLRRAR